MLFPRDLEQNVISTFIEKYFFATIRIGIRTKAENVVYWQRFQSIRCSTPAYIGRFQQYHSACNFSERFWSLNNSIFSHKLHIFLGDTSFLFLQQPPLLNLYQSHWHSRRQKWEYSLYNPDGTAFFIFERILTNSKIYSCPLYQKLLCKLFV